MYKYRLDWYDGHEESSTITLLSEKQYSQEEFNSLIESFIVECFEEYKDEEIDGAKAYSEKFPEKAYEVDLATVYQSFDVHNLFRMIIEKLKLLNFVDDTYEATFHLTGYFWNEIDSSVDISKTLTNAGYALINENAYTNYWTKNASF